MKEREEQLKAQEEQEKELLAKEQNKKEEVEPPAEAETSVSVPATTVSTSAEPEEAVVTKPADSNTDVQSVMHKPADEVEPPVPEAENEETVDVSRKVQFCAKIIAQSLCEGVFG